MASSSSSSSVVLASTPLLPPPALAQQTEGGHAAADNTLPPDRVIALEAAAQADNLAAFQALLTSFLTIPGEEFRILLLTHNVRALQAELDHELFLSRLSQRERRGLLVLRRGARADEMQVFLAHHRFLAGLSSQDRAYVLLQAATALLQAETHMIALFRVATTPITPTTVVAPGTLGPIVAPGAQAMLANADFVGSVTLSDIWREVSTPTDVAAFQRLLALPALQNTLTFPLAVRVYLSAICNKNTALTDQIQQIAPVSAYAAETIYLGIMLICMGLFALMLIFVIASLQQSATGTLILNIAFLILYIIALIHWGYRLLNGMDDIRHPPPPPMLPSSVVPQLASLFH